MWIQRALISSRAPLLRLPGGARPSVRGVSYFLDASIGLSPEEAEVQRLAKDFAKQEMYPYREGWNEREELPIATLQKAGELGFGAIYCKEEFGGTALSRFHSSLIFEQLSAGDCSTAAYMSIHNMCAWMVDSWGTPEQRAKYVPQMAAYKCLGSYCLTEPGSGSDAAALRTTAKSDGEHYILNGSKAFISGSGDSGVYLVMVRHEGEPGPKGIFCILVEEGTPGLHLGKKERKLGWLTHPARIITFEDCKVPKTNQLGGRNEGFRIAMAGINGGRLNIASCSLGAAHLSLDVAIEHMKNRQQFGQRLADMQHLQHRVAAAAAKLHVSRLAVRDAARHLDADSPHKVSMCAIAKTVATDNCQVVVDEALQMLGGYGVLRDLPVEQYLRDCRVHRVIEGTNEIMHHIAARDLFTNETWHTP